VRADPFYEFRRIATLVEDFEQRLAALGREGWSIGAAADGWLYLQRLIAEEEAAKPQAELPAPEEETVDPLCGCGCGESVEIGISAWKEALNNGLVWYLAGHGFNAFLHAGAYADWPRERQLR
jgi:hypothetical protein